MNIIEPFDLSDFRKKNKITQQELAKKLGITNRTIINWEQGKKIPYSKYEAIQKIFREFSSSEVAEEQVTYHTKKSTEEIEKNLELLEKYNKLYKEGVITKAQFEKVRDSLL